MVHEELVVKDIHDIQAGNLLMREPEAGEYATYLVLILKVERTDSIGYWEITLKYPASRGTTGDRYLILDPRHTINLITKVLVRADVNNQINRWHGPRLFKLSDQEQRFVVGLQQADDQA